MRTCVTGVLLTGLLLLAVPVVAQECGDSNGDGTVNIGDLVMTIDAITHTEIQSDPSFHAAEADCDGRAGITMSDVVTLANYLYRGEDYRDCSASGTYSMTPAESDTVFIPYVTDVPNGVTTVDLPIMASLTEATDGVYISLLTGPSVTDNLFDLTGISAPQIDGVIPANQYYPDSDSCSLELIELLAGTLAGERVTYFDLNFTRYSDGVSGIAPSEYVRSPLWRITVEQDGDLFVPVIVFYSVVLPDPTLSVDPTSLAFTAVSGETPIDTYEISFTSDGQPVTFDLDVSQSWVVLDGNPVGPFTTPASFWVSVDGTTLFPGFNTATITPINLDPAEAVLVDGIVSIDFTVNAPPDLPFGDINCDGQLTIGDVALLIDCVFINPRPVPDCR